MNRFLALPRVDGEPTDPEIMSEAAVFTTLADFPFIDLDIYLLEPYGTKPERCTIVEQDGKRMIVGPNGVLAMRVIDDAAV